MEQHVTILGALYIAFSILCMIAGIVAFVVITGGGILSGDSDAMAITSIVGTVIGFFLVIISVPGIIGGIGLLKKKEWARILVIILGCVNLINIPFGTILGVYTLWALTKAETINLFTTGGRPTVNTSAPVQAPEKPAGTP